MNIQHTESPFYQTLLKLFENESIISAVLSHSQMKQNIVTKLTFRPLIIQNQKLYQISEHVGTKVFHCNLSPSECLARLHKSLTESFRQAQIYTVEADYQILISKKGKMTIIKKKPSKELGLNLHNRKKNYLLPEGIANPFLVELGIMSPSGKILDKKRDKFKQVNRFLELVDDLFSQLKPKSHWNIIDFGCGKAYLTFALYHFLHIQKQQEVTMIGIDLKEDVIQNCEEIAQRLGYKQLSFKVGDINKEIKEIAPDIVVSLHACDTATDAALEKAIRWKVEAILCVPCCQHELFSQVKNPVLDPLLKYGILKERFSSLITDAARGQLLEIYGYQTQILEFIDSEHTPKNLMIRAIKSEKSINTQHLKEQYIELTKFLNIKPSLELKLENF